MSELTIEIDCWLHKGLKEYLLSLDGVYEIDIYDKPNFIINIKYDSNLIGVKMLNMEIVLFLNIIHVPSIISFDKHCKNKTKEYKFIIKDLCCEFCLKGIIDDLLSIEGIEKADCNIEENYDKRENVMINISYDPKLISSEEINKLELVFNSYN